MRIFLFIAAALIAAGGTGFYLFQQLSTPAPVAETTVVVEAPKKEVFVPAAELAAGTIITPENLDRMRIEEGAISEEMIVVGSEGETELTGSVARTYLPAGVPIARSALVQPGERGFLAAVLPAGKRAITIAVGEVAGMAGLVMPGDRVDIILTYSVSGDVIDAGRDIKASETLLTNLRVVALDQRLETGNPQKDKEGNLVVPPVARTATLEVTSEQAEMITLATTLGELSLVLNSVRDGGEPEVAEADDGTRAMTEQLRLRAGVAGGVGLAPRALTLDSDVTSLLQRDAAEQAAAENGPGSPVPPADRTSKVQIVRGAAARAIELSAAAAEAAANAVLGAESTEAPATAE